MDTASRRFPALTAVAAGIAALAAVAQYAVPEMTPALRRVPGGGVPDGQWWRLLTPLLVQTLGWYQVAANLVTLPVIGAAAERLLGRGWWLALAAVGTAGGETAAYYWRDPGGGDSILITGLAAGVVVTSLARPATGAGLGRLAVICYIAALTGWGFFGPRGALAAFALAGIGVTVLRAFAPAADRIALSGCVLAALLLAGLEHDLHGASLTAGMIFTAAVLAISRRSRGGRLFSLARTLDQADIRP